MMLMMTNLQTRNVQIGESWYFIKVPQAEAALLDSHGLLDGDIAHLLNGLADLLEQDEELSEREFRLFEEYLHKFTYGGVSLYSYLLEEVGPGAISKNLWIRFANALFWPHCLDVVTDMPTSILEEAAQGIWNLYYEKQDEYLVSPVRSKFLEALGRRTDLYGAENMPSELAFGILIEEKRRQR